MRGSNIFKMKTSLFRNRNFCFGFIIISFFTLVAICAPLFCSFSPNEFHANDLLLKPSLKYLMGTDQLGRDVFSRLIFGARISLSVGFNVILISTVIGVFVGILGGYYGGIIDYCLMRITDIMLCFPVFFLILSVIAMLEPSVFNIILILGLTSWMGQARLMRAEVLSLKNKEFVLAAKAYGASDFIIMLRHLIPNALGPILVSAVLGVANAILAESSLSFLGLGVQPPTPSWGNMLGDAKTTLGIAWWLSIFPGLAILLAILGYNLLAEGVREYVTEKQ